VTNGYQPKFPKAKLHEIVVKYIASMGTAGRATNCTVAFARNGGVQSRGQVRGWLLKDPRPESAGNRYLLLGDGDVWREVERPVAAGADADGVRAWLNGPDDDLVTLLARSLANARMGGGGFLESEEHVDLSPRTVADRRLEQQPHGGPERRTDD
jgi:hypothetical protein